MNTDRELLELAAKAAGISIKPVVVSNFLDLGDEEFVGYRAYPNQCQRGWFNPLADDGDSLRLAGKLGFICNLGLDHNEVSICYDGTRTVCVEHDGSDHMSVIRRAIVRAAADIGRSMP